MAVLEVNTYSVLLKNFVSNSNLKYLIKFLSFKTCSKSDTCFLSSNIFSCWICSAFELIRFQGASMTPTRSWPLVMTLWLVQLANVAGEEARQFWNEVDFNTFSNREIHIHIADISKVFMGPFCFPVYF